jgi:ankyrin repeat protein
LLPIESCDFSLSLGSPCDDSEDRFIEAAVAGDTKTVGEKLDDGADPNRTRDRVTPLRCAVEHHHTDVVALLVEHGARPHNPTFVEHATRSGDVEIVRLLLDAGAEPTVELLDVAAGGSPVDISSDFTQDPRPATADEGAAITKLLLARGLDPNADANGPTPLLWAAFNGRAEVLRLLLAHGADPNRGGVVDQTLIQFATMQMLIGGAVLPEPSGPTVANVPPLVAAASTGNLGIATTLLDAGADPNLAADDAFTAMYAAAVLGNNPMVQLLLDRGAVAVPAVRAGVMTPADAARSANHPDTALLLDTGLG